MKHSFLVIMLFAFLYQDASAQAYSKLKVWLDPTSETLMMNHGVEMDHGVRKKGVFIISDFDSATVAWMDEAGIRYDVIENDANAYYRQRAMVDAQRGNRASCFETSFESIEVPDQFELGSMGGFYTYDVFLEELDSMYELYPNIITEKSALDTFLTHEGRPIYMVRISDTGSLVENEPQVLYTALHHAREPVSLSQLVFYMWYLLENYGSDAEVTRLVNYTEMYFIPMVNPDGYVMNETTDPNGGGLWRKNLRDNGNGTFGVDLNRNYGYEWGYDNQGSSGTTSNTSYRGPFAFSEPETKAVRWFCKQHDIQLALNYHAFGNYLIYPWGYVPLLTPDSNVFRAFTRSMTEYNNYTTGTGLETVGYRTNGDSDDWMYGEQQGKNKIFSMTPEVGGDDDEFWPIPSAITPLCKENLAPNMQMAHIADAYANAYDLSPEILTSTSGTLDFEGVRLGLDFEGPYSFGLEPVSSNILNTGNPVVFNTMNLAENEPFQIDYTLHPELSGTQEVVFDIIISFDGYSYSKRITKTFGSTQSVFTNSGTMEGFDDLSSWGVTELDFVSSPTSITDSPDGLYSANTENELHLDTSIDLRFADGAFLNFYAKWETERGWDYAQLLASPEGENSWTPLCGKHTVEGSGYQDEGQPVWDGFQSQWVQETMDLSDYTGEIINLKFRMVSDAFVAYDGFYFDDFEVVALGNVPLGEAVLTKRTEWSIYPNPVKDRLNVSLGPNTKVTVSVFDLTGRKVLERQNVHSGLSTAELTAGSYVVRLNSGERVQSFRLQVIH